MKKLVFLVDDKPEIAKIISVYLSADYDVQYFSDPVYAITAMKEGTLPNLIISDVNMPNMDGFQFLEYLKSSDFFRHIPIMMLSSIESSADRISLLEAGAVDFMIKPFNPEELKVRVKILLR